MFVIFREIIKLLLWLRYRITIKGIDEIAARGTKGILFLPNHPALIDPIILNAYLNKKFKPRPIGYEREINLPLIRSLARAVRVLSIPDMVTAGTKGGNIIKKVLGIAASALQHGENILLYPAGHLADSKFENIGGNSGVETILNAVPDIRLVLVRTRGLWGSSFGRGNGEHVRLSNVLLKAFKSLILNGIIFGPRRRVMIELYEPDDLPRHQGKAAINRYLESFYNTDVSQCTYIPYTIWERGGIRQLPEPEPKKIDGDISTVPDATRKTVINHLKELTGIDKVDDSLRIANDLGMDSLSRAELIIWIGQEFGFAQGDTDSMQTVADCLLAASGHAISSGPKILEPAPKKWFKNKKSGFAVVPEGDKITDVFLNQFHENPGSIVIADQSGGTKNYRQIVTGIFALQSGLRKIAGSSIGIMLPASAGTCIVYLAVRFSGKIPVMINWTVGDRSLTHCLGLVDVTYVLTSKALTANIEKQGISLESIKEKFIFLEDLGSGLSKVQKISALIRSYFFNGALRKVKIPDTAVILFTSGSENLPKAVPLTDKNLLVNIRDLINGISLTNNDILIGMLPPFHSFGLTGTLLLPLCTGLKTVYHPNPTEALTLAGLIEAYKVSILIGTPAFLNGIVRAAQPSQLDSLQLAFSGAEKCPESVYAALQQSCPHLKVLEGYGITECSPVVSCNTPDAPKPYTIGKIVDSLDYAIINTEKGERVTPGSQGMLLVRGESIFNGYLNYNGASPFVDFEKKSWYKTGDLVKEDQDGVLTFCGRLKRFIKLGGEMISLPAIENVLAQYFLTEGSEGHVMAIEATPDEEHPEIVLFTTIDTDRALINQQIRNSGLSPLYNIRRIVKIDSIPVLGTGKIDYRSLKELL